MSRFYEVYSEGIVAWNQDNQEVYMGELFLTSHEHEDAPAEVIVHEFIIDKWGGQRVELDRTVWETEFINGVVSHGIFESLEEAEEMMFNIAQLDTAPINIKDLLDE